MQYLQSSDSVSRTTPASHTSLASIHAHDTLCALSSFKARQQRLVSPHARPLTRTPTRSTSAHTDDDDTQAERRVASTNVSRYMDMPLYRVPVMQASAPTQDNSFPAYLAEAYVNAHSLCVCVCMICILAHYNIHIYTLYICTHTLTHSHTHTHTYTHTHTHMYVQVSIKTNCCQNSTRTRTRTTTPPPNNHNHNRTSILKVPRPQK